MANSETLSLQQQAARLQDRVLGPCDGYQPWLGSVTREPCGEPNRLLIRTASNAYFPQKMTVISLPDRDETVTQAVDAAWEFLEAVEEMDELRARVRVGVRMVELQKLLAVQQDYIAKRDAAAQMAALAPTLAEPEPQSSLG